MILGLITSLDFEGVEFGRKVGRVVEAVGIVGALAGSYLVPGTFPSLPPDSYQLIVVSHCINSR